MAYHTKHLPHLPHHTLASLFQSCKAGQPLPLPLDQLPKLFSDTSLPTTCACECNGQHVCAMHSTWKPKDTVYLHRVAMQMSQMYVCKKFCKMKQFSAKKDCPREDGKQGHVCNSCWYCLAPQHQYQHQHLNVCRIYIRPPWHRELLLQFTKFKEVFSSNNLFQMPLPLWVSDWDFKVWRLLSHLEICELVFIECSAPPPLK